MCLLLSPLWAGSWCPHKPNCSRIETRGPWQRTDTHHGAPSFLASLHCCTARWVRPRTKSHVLPILCAVTRQDSSHPSLGSHSEQQQWRLLLPGSATATPSSPSWCPGRGTPRLGWDTSVTSADRGLGNPISPCEQSVSPVFAWCWDMHL